MKGVKDDTIFFQFKKIDEDNVKIECFGFSENLIQFSFPEFKLNRVVQKYGFKTYEEMMKTEKFTNYMIKLINKPNFDFNSWIYPEQIGFKMKSLEDLKDEKR